MHELGTIVYVINTVEQLCVENRLAHVRSVTLEVGEVSGIIPRFLTDYWEFSREQSDYLKGAELRIETIDAVTYCEECGQTYSTIQYAKQCPHCQSLRTYLLTGNEYNIKEIEAVGQETG